MKNPRGPGASAILPVGRVRVPKDLGAVAHSVAGEDRTGVSASLLAGRVGSWSLVIGPMSPRAFFRFLG